MKKLTALALALICVFAMAACGQAPIEDEGNTGIANQPSTQPQPTIHACEEFAEYLDDMYFVPQLSQGDLMDQMEKYTCNGKTVLELSQGFFYDGPHGGGIDVNGELCGFSNSYWTTDDGEYATYSNSMYTSVPLDGLELPLEITFDDTIQTVVNKLQLAVDYQSIEGTSVLCSDGDTVIELTKHDLQSELLGITGETGNSRYAYTLEYTQTYQTPRGDGNLAEVTRSVIMSFEEGSGRLGFFKMTVKEYYKVDQATE